MHATLPPLGTPARRGRIAAALRVYAVTDSRWLDGRSLEDVVAQAIEGGATFVQLREKDVSHEERCELARRVLPVCRARGVPFVIDDDVACAREVGADGVHVGQSDASCLAARRELGPDAIVGVSASTPDEARQALEAGADYLGVGAVWATPTKRDADALGIDGLTSVCAATPLPAVAIGGIHAGNAASLAPAGVAGVAVVSALFAVSDPVSAARELVAATNGFERAARPYRLPSVLTIAGSDSSGGAGIQADLKTIGALGCYGQSVLCALTAQNTYGVRASRLMEPTFIEAQLDAVFSDMRPDAVKVGMVGGPAQVHAVAGFLRKAGDVPVVVDPVLVATSGASLASDGTARALIDELFPLASVVTPNVPEARALCQVACDVGLLAGEPVGEDCESMAYALAKLTRGAVLVKGGHLDLPADGLCHDALLLQGKREPLDLVDVRIDTPNTHGTGCTLSSAIACGLAQGLGVEVAVRAAKRYLTDCLAAGLVQSDSHNGPLDHFARLRQGAAPALHDGGLR
ncbi:MAG: bifunctional hydroxymethylpyrimidine kinase/phosphomethylpyrimidine kinase [Coriobacteriia bacterium]|nr:bifunctional hydroxymethylpyrimidine kinase/phosphomethylpyrimidine kinase [Coriobacteriia bacterium]